MARSTYIYVVMRDYPNGAPGYISAEAAFTVKHELWTWLEWQKSLAGLSFFRLPDGRGYGRPGVTEMSLQEITNG